MRGLKNCRDNDLIILSDVDEIPDLNKLNMFGKKNKYAVFSQRMFNYKINLLNETENNWHGSKMCLKKNLKSPQWLRNLKFKKLLGIEPAKNLAKVANREKIKTYNGFLDKSSLRKIKKNADLILDTLNEYHKFIKADVKLISKTKFEGRGIYEYINFDEDTFEIPFSSFELKTYENENNNMFLSTYSYGIVDKSNPILMEPGFGFYGKIELVANNEQLLFNGDIVPSELKNFKISEAIPYSGYFIPGDELALTISEDDNDFTSSISKRNNGLYFNFFANDVEKRSLIFFNPSGQLSYDSYTKQYLIEPQNKTNEDVYNGNSLLYSPNSGDLSFEGKVNLIDNDPNFSVFSSMSANVDSDSFNISSETFMICLLYTSPSPRDRG